MTNQEIRNETSRFTVVYDTVKRTVSRKFCKTAAVPPVQYFAVNRGNKLRVRGIQPEKMNRTIG